MRVGTIFSGCGAPEQAAARVWPNHEISFACEYDKYARQSYLANYEIDEAHFHKDVKEMDGTQYRGKCDILVYGSPCQSFSIAGKRLGVEDSRGQLIYEGFRILRTVKPKFFVYENVAGLLSIDNGQTIENMLIEWADIGYKVTMDLINTKDYGIPQNRLRLFVLGILNN